MTGLRKALIIANGRYDHDGLTHLAAPASDADALAEVLGNPAIGDFQVTVVRDETAHAVAGFVEDLFVEGRADDVLLVHFSCHGLKSESGELFFAARNTRPERLGSTAVAAAFVQRCMKASRSRSVVLLLDCCYGGAFSQGVTVRGAGDVNVLDSFPGGRLGGGRGRAVISASSAMEFAFEGDRLADGSEVRPSLFTAALVEGLATGDADRDQDGWVSLNELYDYVFDRVREQNPHQTPSRDVEMQGELYVARRHGPVPAPAAGPSATPPRPETDEMPAAQVPSAARPTSGAAGRVRYRGAAVSVTFVAVLVIVVTVLVLSGRDDEDPDNGAAGTSGDFTVDSPWRLAISDEISGSADGCTVTVTDSVTDDEVITVTEEYGSVSFQVRESGSFRWVANDPACLVVARSGAGDAVLPFDHDTQGDTDAFEATGAVTISVVDFEGNQSCEFVLHDSSSGTTLDFGAVPAGGDPIVLDPGGVSSVYVSHTYCTMQLSGD